MVSLFSIICLHNVPIPLATMLFWCFFGVLSSKKCGSLVALVFLYYLLIDVNAIIGTKAVLVRPLERVSTIPQF